MVEPNLLNPAKATVAQQDKPATRYDPNRRTPINIVAKQAQFDIDCQIKWSRDIMSNLPLATQAGTDDQHDGYLIFRTKDLAALGKTLVRGDKIVKLAGQTVNLFILRTEFGSHYGGEFKLLRVWFSDRTGQDG